MEVCEREAAPGGAEDAEPGDAVEGVEQGAGEGESVEDFGAGGEFFEVDGAEGDLRFAEGLGDGSEGVAGAAEDGDAVGFAGGAGEIEPVLVAADEGDDFFSLDLTGGFFTVGIGGCFRLFSSSLRSKIDV